MSWPYTKTGKARGAPSKATLKRLEETRKRKDLERLQDEHLRAIEMRKGIRRVNAGRKMTKKQRKLAASVRAKKTRIAKAVKGLLKQTNPAGKFAGAKIRRNKGSITIIPVRLPKRASR